MILTRRSYVVRFRDRPFILLAAEAGFTSVGIVGWLLLSEQRLAPESGLLPSSLIFESGWSQDNVSSPPGIPEKSLSLSNSQALSSSRGSAVSLALKMLGPLLCSSSVLDSCCCATVGTVVGGLGEQCLLFAVPDSLLPSTDAPSAVSSLFACW